MEIAPGLHRLQLGPWFRERVSARLRRRSGARRLRLPGSADAILGALRSLGHEASSLGTILLTHAHLDHSGSAAALPDATGARVVASKVDADLIASGWASRGLTILPGLEETLPTPPGVTAADLVKPSPIDAFEVDGHLEAGAVPWLRGVEAIPAPGHCAGQMAILWDRNGGALVCGDAVTNFGEIAIAPIGRISTCRAGAPRTCPGASSRSRPSVTATPWSAARRRCCGRPSPDAACARGRAPSRGLRAS